MIVLAACALLWPVERIATVRFELQTEGILFQVQVRNGDRISIADPSNAKVTVVGPGGNELTRIVPTTITKAWSQPPSKIEVDRNPAAGWRTLTIDISGMKGVTIAGPAKSTVRYYLPAESPEAADEALRRQWIGKRVWVRGSATIRGDKTILWDPRKPVIISEIQRVKAPILDWTGCPTWNIWNGWDSSAFYCGDPLVVRFKVPSGSWLVLESGSNGNGLQPKDGEPVPDSTVTGLWVADGWQMTRSFTTTSPEVFLRRESAKIRQAFANRDLAIGMPRSLAAYLVGDPEPDSPSPEVWNQRTWTWIGSAPFTYGISFDSLGRVTGYGEQGQLP